MINKKNIERYIKGLLGGDLIHVDIKKLGEGVQGAGFLLRAMLRMTSVEQRRAGEHRRMSLVLWDLFTGSASYRNIFLRTLRPAFVARFVWNLTVSILKKDRF